MVDRYARASADFQDLGNHLLGLKAAGCSTIYRENISGATADRPQLKKLVAILTHRDVVVIAAVARLLRDMNNLPVIAGDTQRAGVCLQSLAEPVGATTSDFAELVLAIPSAAAKLEGRRVTKRTARGRADPEAKRVKFGRKPILTLNEQREAQDLIEAGETQCSVAGSYNISQAKISRLSRGEPS